MLLFSLLKMFYVYLLLQLHTRLHTLLFTVQNVVYTIHLSNTHMYTPHTALFTVQNAVYNIYLSNINTALFTVQNVPVIVNSVYTRMLTTVVLASIFMSLSQKFWSCSVFLCICTVFLSPNLFFKISWILVLLSEGWRSIKEGMLSCCKFSWVSVSMWTRWTLYPECSDGINVLVNVHWHQF